MCVGGENTKSVLAGLIDLLYVVTAGGTTQQSTHMYGILGDFYIQTWCRTYKNIQETPEMKISGIESSQKN